MLLVMDEWLRVYICL